MIQLVIADHQMRGWSVVSNCVMNRSFPLASLVSVVAVVWASRLSADTTFGADEHHAWGANTGWFSFRHDRPVPPAGVVFGESYLSGFAYSANLGWINLGSGSPSNGHTYSHTDTDHGVNHDGAGNLSGFGWSANTGWINFGWASSSDPNRPQVSLISGTFSGYAWSGNIGWVNLGGERLTTVTMTCPDSDGDGIADHWEKSQFGNLTTADATSDQDKDGASDLAEYIAGTNPNEASSYMKVIAHHSTTGGPQVSVQLTFTTTPQRLYRIEHSSELSHPTIPWEDSALGTFPTTEAITTKNLAFPSDTTRRQFFRVVPIRPLTP